MLWRFRDVNEGAQGDNLTSVVEIQHVPCKLLATVLPPLGDEGDTDIPVSVAPETALRPFCQTWKLMKVDQDWVNHSGVFHGDRIYEGDIIRKVVHHDYVIQNVHSGLYAWHAEQAEEDIEVFQRQEPRVWTIIRVAGDHYTIAPAGKQQDELFWTVHGREYPVDNSDQVRLEKPSGIQQHWIIRAVQRDFIPQSEAT
ncbi:hypothetical protein BC835DRAFT_1315336 [Cytidiella melzeri]|nr:hypothetical protein BC835DRAFT_1315336 [Cytidiella melzeri]